MQVMDYSKYSLGNGTEIYVNQSGLYTHTFVDFNFYSRNGENNAAKTLANMLLMQGSRDFPTRQAISMAAEKQYGARINGKSLKIGDLHETGFNIDVLTVESLTQGRKTFENMAALMAGIISVPRIDSGMFNPEYFSKKKEELLLAARRKMMDKDERAFSGFLKAAIGENGFSADEMGEEEAILSLQNTDAVAAYEETIRSFPRKVYVGTNLNPEYIAEILGKYLGALPAVNTRLLIGKAPEKKKPATLEEMSEFDQSVVFAGLPVDVPKSAREREALGLLSIYLGGYPVSRLFTEIRMKRDMAYHTFSRMDLDLGLLYCTAGVDIKNKDAAIGIMLEESKNAAEGKIPKKDFENAKKFIVNYLQMIMHVKGRRLDFVEKAILSGKPEEIDNYEQRYRNVTPQDVIKAASRIKFSPITYCLQQGAKK